MINLAASAADFGVNQMTVTDMYDTAERFSSLPCRLSRLGRAIQIAVDKTERMPDGAGRMADHVADHFGRRSNHGKWQTSECFKRVFSEADNGADRAENHFRCFQTNGTDAEHRFSGNTGRAQGHFGNIYAQQRRFTDDSGGAVNRVVKRLYGSPNTNQT